MAAAPGAATAGWEALQEQEEVEAHRVDVFRCLPQCLAVGLLAGLQPHKALAVEGRGPVCAGGGGGRWVHKGCEGSQRVSEGSFSRLRLSLHQPFQITAGGRPALVTNCEGSMPNVLALLFSSNDLRQVQ